MTAIHGFIPNVQKRRAEDELVDERTTKKSHIETRVNTLLQNIDPQMTVDIQIKSEPNYVLDLENFKRIYKIASKENNLNLLKECNDFYKVYNLNQAIQFKNTEQITSSIINIIDSGDPKWNAILDVLADKYQLTDLKLFTSGFKPHLLRDSTVLSVVIPEYNDYEAIEKIKNCLEMKNDWHLPKIELLCPLRNDEMKSFFTLNEILKSNFPATVRVVYEDARMSNLNETLLFTPYIKQLQLFFHTDFMNDKKNVENLVNLIKKNDTLEELFLIFYNPSFFEAEDFDSEELDNAIQYSKNRNKHVALEVIGYHVNAWNMTPDSELYIGC